MAEQNYTYSDNGFNIDAPLGKSCGNGMDGDLNLFDPKQLETELPIVNPKSELRILEDANFYSENVTESRLAKKSLLEANQQLRIAQQAANAGIWYWDISTGKIEWSEEFYALFHLPLSTEPSFDAVLNIMLAEDREPFLEKIKQSIENKVPLENQYRILDGKGGIIWISALGKTYYGEDGKPLRMAGICLDITTHKANETALRESEEWFRSLAKVSPAGIFRTDAKGQTVYWNEQLCRMTGMAMEDAMGTGFEHCIHPEDRQMALAAWYDSVQQHKPFKTQCRFVHKNGSVIWIISQADAIFDTAGSIIGYVGFVTDITELKHAEEQVRLAAYQDLLTKLPNRRLLNDRLHQEVAKCGRDGHLLAVCYLDLDSFKEINDQFGKDIGDRILIEVSARLLSSVRGGDTVARLGGDEFVILLCDLNSEEECQQILERMVNNIATPYVADESHTITIASSIGVTLYPSDNAEPEILLRHADHAMYSAKQRGKNCCHYFDNYLDQRVESKQEMLRLIDKGLAAGEFQLYYQPKVDFDRRAVTGAEALIRWDHPILGLIEPAKFLPFVEDHDIAIKVGNWVVGEALRQMECWLDHGLDLQISINVFARELHEPGFVQRLQNLLGEHSAIPPKRLRIEILETAALPDLEVVQSVIAGCQALGVSFSLDDFGTGYSSLHYLRNLAVAELKIDQSFVRDMLIDSEALAIVEGIIGLSRAFQRSIVAEGVETPEHIGKLLELGCHQMQGYIISRPLPASQLLPWVKRFQPSQLLSGDSYAISSASNADNRR
jgi:diguanylate cyclase (GGDEF)-like protein/PAS domain S-box-containing protein